MILTDFIKEVVMPHFCECGADTYLCQICLREKCGRDEPSIWVKIPNKQFSGNVCPACAKANNLKEAK